MLSSQNISIGLDVADHSVEVVALKKSGKQVKVISQGRVSLPAGIVEQGRVKDGDALAETLKTLFQKTVPQKVPKAGIVFGLPESQVYVHVFTLKEVKKKHIESTLHSIIAKAIPLSHDDIHFTYRVLGEKDNGYEVLVIATSETVMREWQQCLRKVGYKIDVFDIETLAIFRDLFDGHPKEPVCLVDMGAARTNVSFFDAQGLMYTRSIPMAGEYMTAAMAERGKITPEKAEEKKVQSGLSLRTAALKDALTESLDEILASVKQTITWYGETREETIGKVIFVGGSSSMKGMNVYAEKALGIPVEVGVSKLINKKVPLQFLEAVGLAWRKLDKRWDKIDPAMPHLAVSAKKVAKQVRRVGVAENEQPKPPSQNEKASSEGLSDRSLEEEKTNALWQWIIVSCLVIWVAFLAIVALQLLRQGAPVSPVESLIDTEITAEDLNILGEVEEDEVLGEVPPSEDGVIGEERIQILEGENQLIDVYEFEDTNSSVIESVSPGDVFSLVTSTPAFYYVELEPEVFGWVLQENGTVLR